MRLSAAGALLLLLGLVLYGDSLGDYFLAVAQGSMLQLRTTGNRQAVERNFIHFKQYLTALYGR